MEYAGCVTKCVIYWLIKSYFVSYALYTMSNLKVTKNYELVRI
jgi:hypothetical protein